MLDYEYLWRIVPETEARDAPLIESFAQFLRPTDQVLGFMAGRGVLPAEYQILRVLGFRQYHLPDEPACDGDDPTLAMTRWDHYLDLMTEVYPGVSMLVEEAGRVRSATRAHDDVFDRYVQMARYIPPYSPDCGIRLGAERLAIILETPINPSDRWSLFGGIQKVWDRSEHTEEGRQVVTELGACMAYPRQWHYVEDGRIADALGHTFFVEQNGKEVMLSSAFG